MIRQVPFQEFSMGKEAGGKRENPAFSRFREKSPRGLKELAKTLRDQAAQVDTLVVAMEKLNIKTMKVDGATKDDRGTQIVWEFIAHVEQAITKRKYSPDKV